MGREEREMAECGAESERERETIAKLSAKSFLYIVFCVFGFPVVGWGFFFRCCCRGYYFCMVYTIFSVVFVVFDILSFFALLLLSSASTIFGARILFFFYFSLPLFCCSFCSFVTKRVAPTSNVLFIHFYHLSSYYKLQRTDDVEMLHF